MAALALGFSSCEDKSDLGIEQINPQEPIVKADGLTLTAGDALTNGVNLETNSAESIPVVSVGEMADLPEGASVELEMQLASSEDYSNAKTLAVTNGSVSADEWEEACTSFYGVDPTAREMYVRFAAYVVDGTQLSRLGGDNYWYLNNTKVSVTPVDAKLGVENKYYLVAGGSNLEFSHSDSHPYVDPNFSIVVEVKADQLPYEWMVAPESAVESGNSADYYGVAGSASDLSGNLVLGGQKGVINEAGNYKLVVNMLDKNYSLIVITSPLVDYLYTPGGANGWSFDNNMLLKNNDDNTFSGYVYIDGEFKLTAQPDWNPDNWGLNAGTLTAGGSNFKVDSNGLYYVVANFNDMTAGLTEITSIGVVGSMNGWSEVDNIELTPNEGMTIWTGDVTFDANSEWKFNMNKGWGINLGGAIDNLVQDGGNLTVAEEGTYTVTLDLSKLPYSCTVVKK